MGFFNNGNSQKGPACRQAGQILLVVVLAAVVALTVGLSAVSRTITNTKVTTEEANSQKALSAAEAGIEELVSNAGTLATGDLSNNSRFKAGVTPIASQDILINNGAPILKDDGADIWFSSYPDFGNNPSGSRWSGTMTVYWKDNDGCSVSGTQVVNPAIEVVVISGASKNSPIMTRAAYDACNSRGNNFTNPGGGGTTISGVTLNHRFKINVNNGFIARIIPLYANAIIGVHGDTSLPSQGNIIDSVGTSGNTTRKIKVFQGFPKIPIEYFPYNLFLP